MIDGHREEAAVVDRDQLAALERLQRERGALGRRPPRVRPLDRGDRREHLRAEPLDVVAPVRLDAQRRRARRCRRAPSRARPPRTRGAGRRARPAAPRPTAARDGGALGRLAGEEQRAHEVLARAVARSNGSSRPLVGQAEVLASPPGRTSAPRRRRARAAACALVLVRRRLGERPRQVGDRALGRALVHRLRRPRAAASRRPIPRRAAAIASRCAATCSGGAPASSSSRAARSCCSSRSPGGMSR